ncbi:MAG: hypothetical protein Q8K60_07685 [Parachlamydiaceae bacterium]|nr:hypothetical protein [Parachlamydiaceae bacterium]
MIPSIQKLQKDKILKFNQEYNEEMIVNLNCETIDQLSNKIIPNIIHNHLLTFFINTLSATSNVNTSKYAIIDMYIENIIEGLKAKLKNNDNFSIFEVWNNEKNNILNYTKEDLLNFFMKELTELKCNCEQIEVLALHIVDGLTYLFPLLRKSISSDNV